MKTSLLLSLALLSLLNPKSAFAGSATWNLNPGNSDWNTPGNWTPATVPDGPADIATFDLSNRPSVTLSASVEVSSLIFNSGAAAYLISPKPGNVLTISNTGITNDSGQLQSFATMVDGGGNQGLTFFTNSAAAGSATAFLNHGGGSPGGETDFFGTATADNGTFTNFGGSVYGGLTQFFDSSTAGNGTFINLDSEIPLGGGGHTEFFGTSTAGHATFTNEAGTGSFVFGGSVLFNDTSNAGESLVTSNGADVFGGIGAAAAFNNLSSGGSATVIANGGSVSGATTFFMGSSTAGNATLIANGDSSQSSGGLITFQESSTGGKSRIKLFGLGMLDIGFHDIGAVTIGSLEGDGQVQLGANALTVGSNNLSTRFSGVIDGTGFLIKNGRGSLILSGANTYTGGTSINGGTLLVARRTGSATGGGPVQVNKGTLGGTGKIAGSVTIGTGSGTGAFLSPGVGAPGTLAVNSALTFNSDAGYNFDLNSDSLTADKIVADGVTINGGARFSFMVVTGPLPSGTVFTLIDNTAATPIAGTFSNLADGAIFSQSGNVFRASYEGGDGNDLILTVQ